MHFYQWSSSDDRTGLKAHACRWHEVTHHHQYVLMTINFLLQEIQPLDNIIVALYAESNISSLTEKWKASS